MLEEKRSDYLKKILLFISTECVKTMWFNLVYFLVHILILYIKIHDIKKLPSYGFYTCMYRINILNKMCGNNSYSSILPISFPGSPHTCTSNLCPHHWFYLPPILHKKVKHQGSSQFIKKCSLFKNKRCPEATFAHLSNISQNSVIQSGSIKGEGGVGGGGQKDKSLEGK